ncbi:hypothetical protein D9M73_141780 [compost metagenome]
MRIEPLARGDRQDAPLLVEHHAAFGQIEVERRARGAGFGQRLPAAPQREEGGLEQWRRYGKTSVRAELVEAPVSS